ncbi:MAG TPA: hypothetical protein VGD78_20850 [Chthoniobacterales bacterium]
MKCPQSWTVPPVTRSATRSVRRVPVEKPGQECPLVAHDQPLGHLGHQHGAAGIDQGWGDVAPAPADGQEPVPEQDRRPGRLASHPVMEADAVEGDVLTFEPGD